MWKKMRDKNIVLGVLLLTARILLGQDIVATTSVLSSAIKDITKDKLTVETLVPSGYCPGHFDIKGSHLASIEKSGLLFAQGFEPYLEQIKTSIKRKDFAPVIIKTEGSWFVPENQKKLYLSINHKLSERFPEYDDFFEANTIKAIDEIEKRDRKIKEMMKDIKGSPVICNNHIKEMLQYLGLWVVATYGREEELTPSDIKNLIEIGRKGKITLVIDNLQAGPDTGKVIADELRVPHITISNFPDGFPETPTLRDTLLYNAKRIRAAYGKGKDKVR